MLSMLRVYCFLCYWIILNIAYILSVYSSLNTGTTSSLKILWPLWTHKLSLALAHTTHSHNIIILQCIHFHHVFESFIYTSSEYFETKFESKFCCVSVFLKNWILIISLTMYFECLFSEEVYFPENYCLASTLRAVGYPECKMFTFSPFYNSVSPCAFLSLPVFHANSWWFCNPVASLLCCLFPPDLFILPLILGLCGARLRQVSSLVFEWVRCSSPLSEECSAISGTCCQWADYVVALMRLIAHLLLFKLTGAALKGKQCYCVYFCCCIQCFL